jgi:chromosome segregation protein
MHFQRLKLSGFKSFVEPAELRIEPGLTGVVGPNGCGKSNLLEACAGSWARLRPARCAARDGRRDLCRQRPAPGRAFAEVALTAQTDPDDQWGGELEVVRRIERGAGSAYRVNGRDVRAKDVGLIFADAATGAHSPALVSQGRIAAVIAAKPAERRMMLEEAAGSPAFTCAAAMPSRNCARPRPTLAASKTSWPGSTTRSPPAPQARAAERYKDVSERIRVAEARLVLPAGATPPPPPTSRARKRDAPKPPSPARRPPPSPRRARSMPPPPLAQAREDLFDRRQDAAAHGQRMAALAAQLDAAEQRLADIDRQRARIEEDRAQADQLTAQAAPSPASTRHHPWRSRPSGRRSPPPAAAALDEADRAARAAAGPGPGRRAGRVEAEWRVAQAALAAAAQRLARLDSERQRLGAKQAALAAQPDPALALAAAEAQPREGRADPGRAAAPAATNWPWPAKP